MNLITSIRSGNSGLIATVKSPGCRLRTARLGDLEALAIGYASETRRASHIWDTSKAKIIEFREFRNEFWAQSLISEPAQAFYVAKFVDGSVIFSTQELLRALFGLNATLWHCLFSPRDPGTIRSVGGAKGARVLEWVNAFPSARRAWSSVYAAALDGRLQFELPAARIELRFVCDPRYFQFVMAENMSVSSITALEPSTDGSNIGETTILYNARGERNAIVIPGLSKRDGTWSCTEAEWEMILDIGGRQLQRRKNHERVRRAIDVMLERYGTGASWVSLRRNDVPFWHTDSSRSHLKKLGLIEPIIRAIQVSRSA